MFNFRGNKTTERSNHWIFGSMLVFGVIGLMASFVLAVEEFHLLKDPDATLSCSFNLVLNCSTVMQTWQASVFGFPNMFIGLMGYSVVVTVAVVALVGVKLPRGFWRLATICYGLGAIFAYWLFFQSLYSIEVLCPWCLIVTFVTTILFSTILHYSLRENIFGFTRQANEKIQKALQYDAGKLITASWLVVMVMLVIIKFGDGLFA